MGGVVHGLTYLDRPPAEGWVRGGIAQLTRLGTESAAQSLVETFPQSIFSTGLIKTPAICCTKA